MKIQEEIDRLDKFDKLVLINRIIQLEQSLSEDAENCFYYVDIISKSKECEGWLNLFCGDNCIALINDIDLANRIRLTTKAYNTKTFL